MEKALIVYNPTARNSPPRERLLAAASGLRADGWEIGLISTEGSGHGVSLARGAAAAGASIVFACGGDGTVNEVINGLAGGDCALGIVPGGMGDVFAKEAHISRRPEDALRLAVNGERRRFDLGVAGERYFMLMAGIGFDGEVVKHESSAWKRRIGTVAYVLPALRELARYRSRRVTVKVDGVERDVDLYWALVGNTRSYGGLINITHDAKVDDGMLDAYVFDGGGAWRLASTVARIVAKRQDGARGVTFERLRDLEVLTPGLAVQVDGEYIGNTPMRFSAAPSVLNVLLPKDAASQLFGA